MRPFSACDPNFMKGKILMKQKFFLMLFGVVLFVGKILPSAFSASPDRGELGKITIPREFELDTMMDMEILPPGEYLLSLSDRQLRLSHRKENGLQYGFGIPTEVEKTGNDASQPRIDVSIVKYSGVGHVQIMASTGLNTYTSLLRCAVEEKPKMLQPSSLRTLDPQILQELDTLKETLGLLDKYSKTIWPDWTEYKGLQFTITFPNRSKLAISNRPRIPALYRQMDIVMPAGQRVYVNRSREIPGYIDPIMGHHAGGDSTGVGVMLNGTMNSEKIGPLAPRRKKKADEGRFSRMMMYVHEAFHVMWNGRLLAAETMGYKRDPVAPDRNFTPTVGFGLFSEIEGEALERAFSEKNGAKALDYFKDFLVARERKLKELPAATAAFDSSNTLIEGSATYSSFKMATIVQNSGLGRKLPQSRSAAASAFNRAGDYLEKEMKAAISGLKRETLDITGKHYFYGAYWCLLLDRFIPSWKKDFFEKNRSLDEVTADFLGMTESEKNEIAERLKTDFEYERMKARHSQTINEREDAIGSVANRKGKKFLIDLNHAQSGFDIRPRQFILNNREQIYPRGLAGFEYGSLRLKSGETPMRLIMNEDVLEWIDTDAKPGEKGYILKYQSQAGDLYKGVNLKTKGFSMTAKAVKITEDNDSVKISIWD
jgi:hypothetical protein